jgi:hypothetical protein
MWRRLLWLVVAPVNKENEGAGKHMKELVVIYRGTHGH